MSVALLRQYLREAVIDASKKFADRRSQNLQQKVKGLADDMPNVFAKQEDQEKEINGRLAFLRKLVDRVVSQKRGRMAVPGAFTDEHFGPETSFFDVVSFSSTRDDYYPELKRFVQANAAAFEQAAADVQAELAQIEQDADSMQWPAPWRRYTGWGSAVQNVRSFEQQLRKLLSP